MDQVHENPTDHKSGSDSSSSKRKPGRPKGSKTRTQPVVQEFLPQCRRCGSSDIVVLRKVNEMDYMGTRDGKRFDRITWHRVQCRNCGGVQVQQKWHSDGVTVAAN